MTARVHADPVRMWVPFDLQLPGGTKRRMLPVQRRYLNWKIRQVDGGLLPEFQLGDLLEALGRFYRYIGGDEKHMIIRAASR